jgi:type IV fimbrial biogenesis protein FimT
MRKTGGFTLVELMVVIAIAAILLSLAVPSFSRLIESTALSSDVNTFLSDVRFARNEAVRRGTLIVMCSSSNPDAASPTCNGTVDWKEGWIIFEDHNGNDLPSGEPVIRQQGRLSTYSIASVSPIKFHFVASGRARSLSDAGMMTFTSPIGYANNDSSLQRVLCINMSGRARIAGDGNATCAVATDH